MFRKLVGKLMPTATTQLRLQLQLQLQVRSIRREAEAIRSFELSHPDDEPLPPFDAGAHVDVHLPGGGIRSYSLAGDPHDRSCWTLGVLREVEGRGGSRALHDDVRVGQVLTVGAPRNAFALRPDAPHSILLAGGIGITPLKAMAHVLSRQGRSFELHYCARSERHAAFVGELAALIPSGRLHLHFDGGDPARGLDIEALLARPAAGCHLYYCGPRRFMECCAEASAHWPQGTVHSEHFKAPEVPRRGVSRDASFEVKLARAGITLRVTPEQSIAHALERAGYPVPTSCLSGLCGTCKVDYLEGEVDHRDCVLSEKEKARSLTTCVSRVKSASLVLDL